jgi:hypothetical protein
MKENPGEGFNYGMTIGGFFSFTRRNVIEKARNGKKAASQKKL